MAALEDSNAGLDAEQAAESIAAQAGLAGTDAIAKIDLSERHETDQLLRDSERRYRGLFRRVRVSVWEEDFSAVLDMLDALRADGVTDLRRYLTDNPDVVGKAVRTVRVVDVNDYTLELFEADRKEQLLGRMGKVFLPETSNTFIKELVTLWDGGRQIESETIVRTLKGRRLDVLYTINFEGERCERTFVTIFDVTEQKRAQAAQQQLASIVETSNEAILSKDLEGTITSWNAGAERLYGYRAKEVIGKSVTILFPPELVDEEKDILARIKSGEVVDHYDTVRRRKDGSSVEISLTVSPIKDADGNVVEASTIARDISEQKQIERMLRAQRRRLTTLNRLAKLISSDLSLENVVQKVTDHATELSGAKFGAFFYNMIDENGESFLLYALSGAPREAFDKFGLPRNTEVFDPTFRGRGVVRSPDIRKDPRYGRNSPHHGMPKGHLPVVSYLAVPVKSRSGEVLGGLFFGHPDPGVFTKDSELLVKGIASHAAIAIDNARLHEAAQQEVSRRREAEEAKDLLLHEMRHRVKNTLGTVMAIASQTFHEAPAHEQDAFAARLQALAGAHDVLTDGEWKHASVDEIVRRAIEPFLREQGKRVHACGTTAWLDAEKSLLLSMVLHELGTNAVKYGALSNREGRVEMNWELVTRRKQNRLKLSWIESGGPPVRKPECVGFGTQLLKRTLRGERGAASFDFRPKGLHCSLEITLD